VAIKLFPAKPRGFYAGVARAIDAVTAALELLGAPVYVEARATVEAIAPSSSDHTHADDICYAAQNRQAAVCELASLAEVMLVVGAANSDAGASGQRSR
jgi:4-hydroxy-3-methylbut-2-enyl diphosphate reductase IspH